MVRKNTEGWKEEGRKEDSIDEEREVKGKEKKNNMRRKGKTLDINNRRNTEGRKERRKTGVMKREK